MDVPADQIIQRYQLSPPVDVFRMVEDFGIRRRPAKLESRVVGQLVLDRETPPMPNWKHLWLEVSDTIAVPSQRFVAARLLAHWILHRRYVEIDGLILYDTLATKMGPAEDKRANYKAFQLIAPEHVITELIHAGVRDTQTLASRLDMVENTLQVWLNHLRIYPGMFRLNVHSRRRGWTAVRTAPLHALRHPAPAPRDR